jgi:hypothetical protein
MLRIDAVFVNLHCPVISATSRGGYHTLVRIGSTNILPTQQPTNQIELSNSPILAIKYPTDMQTAQILGILPEFIELHLLVLQEQGEGIRN